ncbi:GEVED domain-containing protein [Soonwooa sp.]|uniref:T9SS type A sorting domain-containing protein n=1 Tax=Soonwooa sp. TaxID=1938592 RepID=UPI002634FBB2|nr:GEVED domain-containing protein [Soonwooa sp.]
MKRHYLSFLSLLVGAAAFGQTLISEGFENGIPSSWSIKSTSTTETWTSKPAGTFPYLKTGLAYVEVDPNTSISDEWLITPSFDLSTATTPAVEFTIAANPYFWVEQDTSDFFIKISTDNGTTWTQIWDKMQYPNTTNGFIPQRIRINLDQYIGKQNVKIAFQNKAHDVAPGTLITAVMLDNISVTAKRDPYCVAYFPENKVTPITNVTFAGINNSSSNTTDGSDSYQNFTNIVGEANKEQTYEIQVKANYAGPTAVYITAFIDWNGNGTFAGPEKIFLGKVPSASTPLVANITIPTYAKPGLTRMRIISSNSIAASTPCFSGQTTPAGQIEDYSLLIKGASVDPVDDGCSIFYPGSFEDGTQMQKGVISANDFVIKANRTMDIKKLEVPISNTINVADLIFYKDNNGQPGEIVKKYSNVAPSLQIYQVDSNGSKVYKNTFDLPETLSITTGANDTLYWLGMTNPQESTEYNYWNTADVRTNSVAKVSTNNGASWIAVNVDVDGAFNLYGDCSMMGTTEANAQKASYFPNPVTDKLFIKSKKDIANISIYNFAGQVVKSNIKLNNEELNLTSLQKGNYLVTLSFADGSSDSFKIIKQ